MSDDIEGITPPEGGLDFGEFAGIAQERTRGFDFLDEPQDVDLRLVELSASFLDPDNILRTYSITADGFDPEAYDHSGDVATDGGQIGTTKSLEFAFSEYFGRHGSRPVNLQTKQKIREFAQWCADNGIEFLDVGVLLKGEKVVATDGGVNVGTASTEDMDVADSDNPPAQEFAFEAMSKDHHSVSVEGNRYLVTVRGEDRGMLDGSSVVDLAHTHGLGVVDVYADAEEPSLTIEVGRR